MYFMAFLYEVLGSQFELLKFLAGPYNFSIFDLLLLVTSDYRGSDSKDPTFCLTSLILQKTLILFLPPKPERCACLFFI